MADQPSPIVLPTLIRAGPRVINALKLIVSEDRGVAGVDVTLESGVTIHLDGLDADAWRTGLASLVPPPAAPPKVGPVAVIRRLGPSELRC